MSTDNPFDAGRDPGAGRDGWMAEALIFGGIQLGFVALVFVWGLLDPGRVTVGGLTLMPALVAGVTHGWYRRDRIAAPKRVLAAVGGVLSAGVVAANGVLVVLRAETSDRTALALPFVVVAAGLAGAGLAALGLHVATWIPTDRED